MSDLIKREDAIKAYNEAMEELVKWQMEEWQLGDFSECEFNTTDCKHIVRKLEAIPSADRPQGEWIEVDDASISCRCSACGWEAHLYEDDVYGMPYCPNCGAHMAVKGADDE